MVLHAAAPQPLAGAGGGQPEAQVRLVLVELAGAQSQCVYPFVVADLEDLCPREAVHYKPVNCLRNQLNFAA